MLKSELHCTVWRRSSRQWSCWKMTVSDFQLEQRNGIYQDDSTSNLPRVIHNSRDISLFEHSSNNGGGGAKIS